MTIDKRLKVDDLSPDQREVFGAMSSWANDGSGPGQCGAPLLTVGGLAGTGKTTLLGVFAANTPMLVAYVTFTGRASSILARKLKAAGAQTTDRMRPPDGSNPRGARAAALFDARLPESGGPGFVGTIHRLLYSPIIDSTTEELLGWRKRGELDRKYDLIVIDEASMVGGAMLDDLKAHGVPILAVGDHGQLPPVMDSGDLMKDPDLRLEKIHRQAEGNPIIRLAHGIRQHGIFDQRAEGGAVVYAKKSALPAVLDSAYLGADQNPLDVGILCWTNKSRVGLNASARKALGHHGAPRAGEVVIALKNKPPVYNGMRGVLTKDSVEGGMFPWHLGLDVAFPDEGLTAAPYVACAPQFCREKTFASTEELKARGMQPSFASAGSLFDFGYAMTVHKSQGSGWDHGIVYVDRPVKPDDEDWRRWAYTAVTRAANRLTVLR